MSQCTECGEFYPAGGVHLCVLGNQRRERAAIDRALESQRKEIPAARILRKAAELVEQRAASRDKPDGEKSMLATVKAFNAIYGMSLTEVQGWHFMELLKMVRSAQGVYVADDYDDKVAYAALAAEAAEGEKR